MSPRAGRARKILRVWRFPGKLLYIGGNLAEKLLQLPKICLGEVFEECAQEKVLGFSSVQNCGHGSGAEGQVRRFPIGECVTPGQESPALQGLDGGGDVGLGQLAPLRDIGGGVKGGIVGEEKQNIQLRPRQPVLLTDGFDAFCI